MVKKVKKGRIIINRCRIIKKSVVNITKACLKEAHRNLFKPGQT